MFFLQFGSTALTLAVTNEHVAAVETLLLAMGDVPTAKQVSHVVNHRITGGTYLREKLWHFVRKSEYCILCRAVVKLHTNDCRVGNVKYPT